MRKCVAFTILALLLIPAVAYGQAQKGSVTVTVTDQEGGRLPGVTVTAESDETLSRRTAITGADGVATLAALDPASNYVVTTALEGFNGSRHENVRVAAGQNSPIAVTLQLATVTEEVIVTAESPLVDVTSATTGQDITLELTEALPTGRSYQSYLQLVPGVQASTSGNPASRSGINYSDIGGVTGTSTDNFYYFEGINVTDNLTGTFGANLNTEIIQEQSVVTGGLAAEFIGATGLVSNVITKSGGNQFSGSVNYYLQNDSLVADDKHAAGSKFSTFDTAVTFGGPVARDKAWFFGSYRLLERDEDVFNDSGQFLRPVKQEQDQAFLKLTWAPTQSDLLSGTFLNDPFTRDGSFTSTTTNLRDSIREQGGNRYSVNYTRVWSSLVLDLGATDHEGDVDDIAKNLNPRNTVIFRAGEVPGDESLEQFGGAGFVLLNTRGNEAFRGSLEYLASTSWGDHTLKGGFELTENQVLRDNLTPGGATYTSLDLQYLGQNVTAGELASSFSAVSFDPTNTSDYNGLIASINAAPNAADYYAAFDVNRDGTISSQELADHLIYNSTAGNPDGKINYDRTAQTMDGAQFTSSEGTTFYIQDNWQWNRWSVNLGMRTEEWDHFDTNGDNIYTFEWEYAPRVSIAYDLKGDGRQRLSGYYGRYYDPIRNNMTNFAGSVSGRVREEQVFILGDWLTYRIRGGPVQADALFAPSTQTPYTDEWMVGYKVDMGRNMSFEANVIRRETNDILEDYDLALYADAATYNGQFGAQGGDISTDPNSLFLGLGYFGYNVPPVSNFVIATLARGSREWEGLELVFRKRMSNNWQMLASYNYAQGEGNSNSDSNADFQGDVIWLDPGAPNQFGNQPGLVEHLFKAAATYQWNNGLSVGGAYRWNSGTVASRTFRASGRNLPCRVANTGCQTLDQPFFSFAGVNRNWLASNSVGTLTNPSYGLLDLRASYLWRIGGRYEADFFLDVFNVLDDQEITRMQDLVAGRSGVAFQQGITFADPRRFFLGARLRF